jgi:hypothetical protein
MTAAITAIKTIDVFLVIFYEISRKHITLTGHKLLIWSKKETLIDLQTKNKRRRY